MSYVEVPIAAAFAGKGMDVSVSNLLKVKIELFVSGVEPTKGVSDETIKATSVDFTADETCLERKRGSRSQQREDNILTISGELMHKSAYDTPFTEKRGDILITRGVPIMSNKLVMIGVCDVVEFHRNENGALIYGYEKLYRNIPV